MTYPRQSESLADPHAPPPQARSLKALALTLDQLGALYHERSCATAASSSSSGGGDPEAGGRDLELLDGLPYPLRGRFASVKRLGSLVSSLVDLH